MKAVSLTEDQVAAGPSYVQLRRYFHTAKMRHQIYIARQRGLSRIMWTDDPILFKYRFCNVYRELDKVTIWIRENWREPYADHPNLAFAMALARLINWPPSLEEIGFPKRWQPARIKKILHHRKSQGLKVFTGAYLLGGGIPPGGSRIDHMTKNILTPLYNDLHNLTGDGTDCLEGVWEGLKMQRGIGPFIAYEIVSDLRHTRYLRDAPDIMTWANPGPGALRGLTRLWGYHPKTERKNGKNFPKAHAFDAMRMLLKMSKDKLPSWMPKWEMREVEHWLCEFDKYERIRHGEGILDRFEPVGPGQWHAQLELEV